MQADELTRILRDMHISNAELCRRLGIDPSTIHRWTTGKTPVPDYAAEYVRVLALAYRIVNPS